MTAPKDRESPARGAQSLTITDFLDVTECFDKLASRKIGRVIFSQGALPVVTPARYVVNGPELYLATGPHDEQYAGISGSVIAFEVDDLDPNTGSGWTVTVTGIAEPCTHPSYWRLVTRLGLAPFGGEWGCIFRLPVGIISGRRFAASEPLLKEYPDETLGKAESGAGG